MADSFATLLVRAARGPAAAEVIDRWRETHGDATDVSVGDDTVVVWLGDVVSPNGPPLALAVAQMRATAEVTLCDLAGPRTDAGSVARLAARLAGGVVEAVAAEGHSTVRLGEHAAALATALAEAGLTAVDEDTWAIEC